MCCFDGTVCLVGLRESQQEDHNLFSPIFPPVRMSASNGFGPSKPVGSPFLFHPKKRGSPFYRFTSTDCRLPAGCLALVPAGLAIDRSGAKPVMRRALQAIKAGDVRWGFSMRLGGTTRSCAFFVLCIIHVIMIFLFFLLQFLAAGDSTKHVARYARFRGVLKKEGGM